MQKSVHSKDQVYTVIMPACIADNSTVLVFDADHLSRDDMLDDHNDQAEFVEMIEDFYANRVPRGIECVAFPVENWMKLIFTRMIHVHSLNDTTFFEPFLKSAGMEYPNFLPSDFLYASPRCASSG